MHDSCEGNDSIFVDDIVVHVTIEEEHHASAAYRGVLLVIPISANDQSKTKSLFGFKS